MIKIAVTLAKYVPQVLLNHERRSTSGFSIAQVLQGMQHAPSSVEGSHMHLPAFARLPLSDEEACMQFVVCQCSGCMSMQPQQS